MRALVLDTIHGAEEIGRAFTDRGYEVDAVDIYRGTTPEAMDAAYTRDYDLVTAPVHTDPDHPLIRRAGPALISHHAAVRRLLGPACPRPMIEITGSRGKTTTAHALAHTLGGPGILHTSAGTFALPEHRFLYRKSIAPASVLSAAGSARELGGFLVAEESLGVTGAGDLAIITSAEDYPFAAGKKRALGVKIATGLRSRTLLVAPDVPAEGKTVIHIDDIAWCDRDSCTITWHGQQQTIHNPLFFLPPYRVPLMLAAGAAVILGQNPAPLATFEALAGRMAVSRHNGFFIVDNANSGTNLETTLCAARYARHLAGIPDLTLVIGQAEGDGKVCEGFSRDQVLRAIAEIQPDRVVMVGSPITDYGESAEPPLLKKMTSCATFEEARQSALALTLKGSIVLAVKTWR